MVYLRRLGLGLSFCLLVACGSSDSFVERVDYLLGTRVSIKLEPLAKRKVHEDLEAGLSLIRKHGKTLDSNLDEGFVADLARAGEYRWKDEAERDLILPLMERALELAVRSSGAFDPALGALTRVWGFSSLRPRLEPPTRDEIKLGLEHSGFHLIQALTESGIGVRRGTRLDLGGIAKGYLADLLAGFFKELGYRRGIIDLGGNILLLGEKADHRPWRVALKHPRLGNDWWGIVQASDLAIVTSGDYERFFEFEGERFHHILEPRTGWPARGVASVTIIGPEALIADGLSTALFVLGAESGLELLERHYPDYEALFLLEEQGGGLVEIVSREFKTLVDWEPVQVRER